MSETIIFDVLEPDPAFPDKVEAYLYAYNGICNHAPSTVRDEIISSSSGVNYDVAAEIVGRAEADHRVWRGSALRTIGATVLKNS